MPTQSHTQNCRLSAVEYAYDDGGNMLERKVLEGPLSPMAFAFGGPGAGPNMLASATSAGATSGYTYDLNANQVSGDWRTAGPYTSFGLPTRIAVGGVSYGFEYDAFRQRARKVSGGDEAVYTGGLYERRIRGLLKAHGGE